MIGRAAISFSLLLWAAPQAFGTVRVVDRENGPYFQIQAAIDASAAGDTVEVAPGTYTEALQAPVSLTLLSRDGPDVTILDGRDNRRLLEFHGVDLSIAGFTLQHGEGSWGGGAILYSDGSLTANDCTFRDNAASSRGGGGVRAYGVSTGTMTDCLFVGNEVRWSDPGGAVAIHPTLSGTGDSAANQPQLDVASHRFLNCSFLSNRAEEVAAIYSSQIIDVQNCLFADKQGTPGSFVEAPVGSTFACNLYHTPASPQFEGTWKATEEEGEIDPRLCPENSEAVHESSPALGGWQGCGVIGNLPVGCTGPIALAARPLALEMAPDQAIRVYGYGLEDVLEARLEGPAGVTAWDLSLDGPMLTAHFDLSSQPGGSWSLVLRTAGGEDLRTDGFVLGGTIVWGFFDGWVPEPTLYEGKICGKRMGAEVSLQLEHAEDGSLLPVELIGRATEDTLIVRVDLHSAPEGAWNLLADFNTGESFAIRPALYLGTPPVIRVPEDQPTIGAALQVASPCAEIVVAEGFYRESLTIEKPVRLRGVGYVRVRPAAAGQRGILVLPDAGPLTVVENLVIQDCNVAGPGAGILSHAPATMRENLLYTNRSTGPGARGAGIYAAPGSRIIDNRFYGNEAGPSILPDDPWSTDRATGGVAAGLFCLDCWIAGNETEGNIAESAAGIVATGILRRNKVQFDYARSGPYFLGAIRGEITNNRFDNCCGTERPFLLVEGPSFLRGNVLTDHQGPLCGDFNNAHLRGSMDLIENVFANVGIFACLAADLDDEMSPGHFVMERNLLTLDGGGLIGFAFEPGASCPSTGDWRPENPIPPDSIRFSCNMRSRSADVTYGGMPCGDCAYELDDLPQGCPDTLPAFEYGCDIDPVLLQSYGIEATAAGVRLFWTIPIDQSADGFDVEREHLGWRERVNVDRLPPCHECEYIDADPPYGEATAYYLLLYADGEEPQEALLGVWDGHAPAVGDRSPRLLLPAPHPVRSIANLRFELPVEVPALRLEVLDLQGRRVARVGDGRFSAGAHVIPWDARDAEGRPLASGVYVLRLTDGRGAWTVKFLLLR